MTDDASAAAARDPWRPAVIEAIADLTPTIKRFRLRPANWRPFLAGQHVDVRLTAPDGYTAQRSYSVTSSPDERGIIELAIERLDDGEVSPYFHDVAQVGDEIELRGPFTEHFVWRPAPDEPVLLVGGGSGAAPFISMLRRRATLPVAPPMSFLYSVRTWRDVMYREELLRLVTVDASLRLRFALTRDEPRRAEDVGRRVDAALLADELRAIGAPPRWSYVCGRNAFVETVTAALVSLGVPASAIRTERYGG